MKKPSYPRLGTTTSRYLARFLTGEKLKHRDADRAAGSYRLSGYVHYLKTKHNWLIESRELTEDTLDPIGRKAVFTQYWLAPYRINSEGAEAQNYAQRVLGWEAAKVASRVAGTTLSAEIDRTSQSTIEMQPTIHKPEYPYGEK